MVPAAGATAPDPDLDSKEVDMAILSDDMKRVVREQRMGFIATVCPDGTPNLSPKGTTAVWDDDHLVFADLASPTTMSNLRHNPVLELNVVDVYARKGYRFKGRVDFVEKGEELFDEIRHAFENGTRGIHPVQLPARSYVMLRVERAPSGGFPPPMYPVERRRPPVRSGRSTGPACTKGGCRK